MSSLPLLQHLGLALAIGLLIGAERGWQARERSDGRRVAGIRTFGLSALSGGLVGVLSTSLGTLFAAFGLLSFAGLVMVGYWLDNNRESGETDRGMTTEVALLSSFILGMLATLGQPLVAAISAVVITTLLSLKPQLHQGLQRLSPDEVSATVKFLLISVVMLPLLPNQGFGPWQAFNPYVAWWMVVLVSGLSFAGYIAIKLAGERHGILLASVLGGLVSSTVTTLSLAQHARAQRFCPALLAAGILATSSIMFLRVIIEAGVINPALLGSLILPMLLMSAVHFFGAWWLWRSSRMRIENPALHAGSTLNNPFELGSALKFGLLLSLILVLSVAAREYFGDTGLYLLALISGLADVDALTLAAARMSLNQLSMDAARNAIVIATLTNTAVKLALAWSIGGTALGQRVGVFVLLATVLAALSLLF